jgi:hypothetical protein
MPYGFALDAMNFVEPNTDAFPVNEIGKTFNPMGTSSSPEDKMMFPQIDAQDGVSIDFNIANDLAAAQDNGSLQQNNVLDMENRLIPRPLSCLVEEKMLRGLLHRERVLGAQRLEGRERDF